jgi:hypothetical protein
MTNNTKRIFLLAGLLMVLSGCNRIADANDLRMALMAHKWKVVELYEPAEYSFGGHALTPHEHTDKFEGWLFSFGEGGEWIASHPNKPDRKGTYSVGMGRKGEPELSLDTEDAQWGPLLSHTLWPLAKGNSHLLRFGSYNGWNLGIMSE